VRRGAVEGGAGACQADNTRGDHRSERYAVHGSAVFQQDRSARTEHRLPRGAAGCDRPRECGVEIHDKWRARSCDQACDHDSAKRDEIGRHPWRQ